ncbi:MAG: Thymidylate kinase [Candidatus Westeberhardia cardiocondylae]|nr:Thymidylate kinase [Candidatus Westeberhardia cardiocondylae]
MYGKFIVIEGIEGSGKTTAVKVVMKILRSHNICNIISTREPESTPLSKKLYMYIKNKIYKESINKYTELLIFYISRIQLLENVIKPALSKGIWVVSDRHDFSSEAYQCGGRKINKKFLNALRYEIIGNFKPNLILYLDVFPSVGLSRIKYRKLDYIEKEPLSFFKRVRKKYKKIVKNNKNTFTVNANETLEKVHFSIKKKLINWLKNV